MKNRTVTIESGELQGIFGWDPRILVFKGVPYAAPPVGDLRWKARSRQKAGKGCAGRISTAPWRVSRSQGRIRRISGPGSFIPRPRSLR